MKAFFKGLLFAVIGGAVPAVSNWLGQGHFSPTVLGTSVAVGVAGTVAAYLHPSPSQQAGS